MINEASKSKSGTSHEIPLLGWWSGEENRKGL